MHQPLIGAIVGVGEERCPTGGQTARLHCKAVVLCRDEAALRVLVHARLVVPTVPVPGGGGGGHRTSLTQPNTRTPPELEPCSLHLIGVGAQGQGQQLVAQAHPEDGLGVVSGQHGAQVGHCLLAQPRVPGAVAEEEPIEVCAQTAALGWGPHSAPYFRESQRGPQPHSSQMGSCGGHRPHCSQHAVIFHVSLQ